MWLWGKNLTFGLAGLAMFILADKSAAQDISATKTHGPWIDSRPLLEQARPEVAPLEIPIVQNLHQALLKGLGNPELQRNTLTMQQQQGTLDQNFGEGYLAKNSSFRRADANGTHAMRWTLFRNIKTYSGKEIRVDIVPEKIKQGFRFDQSAPKVSDAKASVFTGPQIRYGLVLRNIEPNQEENLKIASLATDSDHSYFLNAPKANVEYEIGPIAVSPAPQTYNFNAAPDVAPKSFNWKEHIPDHRFRGRFSPRGLPTAAKPIPDQTLVLEQVEGLYSTEIQFVNGLQKESVLHRFNLPIYRDLKVYEEYNEKFQPLRAVLSNAWGKGYYSTIERSFVDKRYRAGAFYRMGYSNIELYMNLPESALNPSFKKLQTWELNVLTAL